MRTNVSCCVCECVFARYITRRCSLAAKHQPTTAHKCNALALFGFEFENGILFSSFASEKKSDSLNVFLLINIYIYILHSTYTLYELYMHIVITFFAFYFVSFICCRCFSRISILNACARVCVCVRLFICFAIHTF